MKGFLLDENLPGHLRFTPSLPLQHVRELGRSVTGTFIWNYAMQNDLVILTKDADFSDRILLASPPPRVVHIRLGSMRLHDFHAHLADVWPHVETLLYTNKLVNICPDRIEAAA